MQCHQLLGDLPRSVKMMLSLFSWVVLALYANAATVEVRKAQPVTIPLSSRKIAPGANVRPRATSAANLGLKDYFNGTDLQWVYFLLVLPWPQC